MQFLFLLLSFVLLFGCADKAQQAPIVEPVAVVTATDWAKKLSDANAARTKAVIEGDRLAQLAAEKDELRVRVAKGQQELRDYTAALEQKDKEIAEERTAQQSAKLYWFSGIMGFVSLLAIGVSIVFITNEIVAKYARWLAIAATALAAVAIVFAQLLPYLYPIGVGVLLIGAIVVLVAWKRDNKGLHQLVDAVESVKDKIPGFKDAFNRKIDSDVDTHIDAVRNRIKVGAEKKRKKVLIDPDHA